MSNRIKELEKEIALTKELIELRRKLGQTEGDPVKEAIQAYNGTYSGGGLVPKDIVSTIYGGSDIRMLTNINSGKLEATTTMSADANYKKLKYGEDSKVDNKSQWDSSQEMWKGIKVPSYTEGRGPCECEYVTE